MICPKMEDRLNDYADGSLPEIDRREVVRHLQGCPGCREGVEDLRAILSDLSALPRDLDLPRDRWPETLSAMRQSASSRTRRLDAATSGRAFWTAPRLALAAGLLVVSAATTILLVRGWPGPPVESPDLKGGVIPASAGLFPDVEAAEADFDRATRNLLEVMRRRRSDLPPEALVAIEANLRIVDQAITEARAALGRDPSNVRLGRIVTATYQKKLDLLRSALRLPSPA